MKAIQRFFKHSFPLLLALSFIGIGAGCATVQQQSSDSGSRPAGSASNVAAATTDNLKRPIPNPIDHEIPYLYKRAVDRGTRAADGSPGPEYWQQRADYTMDVELIPDENRIVGSSTITYHNNSPDSLNILVLELAQNVHGEGAIRKERVEVTGGVELKSLALNGAPLEEIRRRGQSGYLVEGTQLYISPSRPIVPGSSTTITVEWSFVVPQDGAGGRMGHSEDNLFFIAYWYPQMMVYDDVFGWFTDDFTNNAEFYHEFGEYEVSITAPKNWLVTATGNLLNEEEVLAGPVLKRYREARMSDEAVTIVGEDDFGSVAPGGSDGKLTWRFQADNVRDFAFSATRESIWEGARAPIGDLDGDGRADHTFVDALYRESASKWTRSIEYARHSITFLSDFTGINYPWPHMTSIEGGGIIGGGMEFPMMTIIGSYNFSPQNALYYVIAHEFAHMWVPMIVSTNERRYSWMDEGITTFNENQARKDFFPDANNPDVSDFNTYNNISGTFYEGPIMRWSDYHYPGPGFTVATYSKPATGLVILRNLLGDEVFLNAYRTFLDRWKYKHPYPWDMFNTFEEVSGRELDWFWRSFYYETWILDQAVAEVSQYNGGARIVIEDRGQIPLPAHVVVTLEDGSKIRETVDVDTWLQGATTAAVTVNASSPVARVQIDPEYLFPDANRSNNTWTN